MQDTGNHPDWKLVLAVFGIIVLASMFFIYLSSGSGGVGVAPAGVSSSTSMASSSSSSTTLGGSMVDVSPPGQTGVGDDTYFMVLNVTSLPPLDAEVYMGHVKLGDMTDGVLRTKRVHLSEGWVSYVFDLNGTVYGFSCWLSREDILEGALFECVVYGEELNHFNFIFGEPGRLYCGDRLLGYAQMGVVESDIHSLDVECHYRFYPERYEGSGRYVGFYLNESFRDTNTFIMPVNFSDERIWESD
mgnify:CR=1 FL=1